MIIVPKNRFLTTADRKRLRSTARALRQVHSKYARETAGDTPRVGEFFVFDTALPYAIKTIKTIEYLLRRGRADVALTLTRPLLELSLRLRWASLSIQGWERYFLYLELQAEDATKTTVEHWPELKPAADNAKLLYPSTLPGDLEPMPYRLASVMREIADREQPGAGVTGGSFLVILATYLHPSSHGDITTIYEAQNRRGFAKPPVICFIASTFLVLAVSRRFGWEVSDLPYRVQEWLSEYSRRTRSS